MKDKLRAIAIATVDIVIFNNENQILLARKQGKDKWCFPGGFVDPVDNSYLDAAKRECSEEILNMTVSDWEYITYVKINDPRFVDSPHIILTNLFTCEQLSGEPSPGDDLKGGEVAWFDIMDNVSYYHIKSILQEHHHILLETLNTRYLQLHRN